MFKKGGYIYYAMGNGMFYFSWAMFACIISVYLADVGCSATEISLVTSASALFAMATQPICGFLADRFRSPKYVAIISAILAIISGILFAYTKSFVFLFLMNGLTQGFLNGITALSDRLATASPYPFGSIRVWGSILYAIGAQISGYVYDNISPKANYYIFAVGIAVMVFSFIMMNDAKPLAKEGESEKVTTKEVLIALWHNKPFKMFMLIYFLFQGAASAQGIYLPLFIKQLGGTTTIVGTTLLFSTLSELPAVLFSDKLIKKVSYKHLMIFACVMSLIRFVWYSTCPTPNMIMVMFFFQGMTSIIFILVAVRIILDLVEDKYVNTAYGISSMLAKGLAALIFQVICGKIIDIVGGNFGYTITYYIFAATMVVCILLSWRFKMPEKKEN